MASRRSLSEITFCLSRLAQDYIMHEGTNADSESIEYPWLVMADTWSADAAISNRLPPAAYFCR